MLNLIRRVFCPRCFPWGTGTPCEDCDTRTPVERWSERNAKLCSPEQLIEAHIINSIAKNFDDWKMTSKHSNYMDVWGRATSELAKKHTNIDVSWCNVLLCNRNKHRNVKGVSILYRNNHGSLSSFYVNGVSFNDTLGAQIVNAFEQIKEKRRQLDAAAAEALRNQKVNEDRWNLAEELLGMKRNEYGALVPVKTVEA